MQYLHLIQLKVTCALSTEVKMPLKGCICVGASESVTSLNGNQMLLNNPLQVLLCT